MPEEKYIDEDSVKVRDTERDKLLATLFWGDPVQVIDDQGPRIEVEIDCYESKKWVTRRGFLPPKTRLRSESTVLKVRFIDVGQGDGAIFETPQRQLVVIDGGENTNLVRYTSVALHRLLKNSEPASFDAVVVTHGDADHFAGLTTMLASRRSEKNGGGPRFMPKAVFHSGLVKRPSKEGGKDVDMFGETQGPDGVTYCTELVDDLVASDPSIMNEPFREWRQVLENLQKTAEFPVRRLEFGQDDAFSALTEGDSNLKIEVLGPIVERVNGKPALRFLKKPGSKSLSASHTINGHSIVLRITYGNVRFLFGADLNEESEERLLQKVKAEGMSIEAEILKVPHHGSHEFIPEVLEAISPVVSVVSSGDESGAKEYIHPRSGLVGALGKYSRSSVVRPLIFVTEMVAFFAEKKKLFRRRVPKEIGPGMKEYELVPDAYVKSQFGIVHVRTNGKRVLVFTHSGRQDLKEKYAFTVDENHNVEFEK
jgi:beta-lactamase superfamily II metal-dependent hydrolase